MSDLNRRLLDGIRLTTDAYDAGQLMALREARGLLVDAVRRPTILIATTLDREEKAQALGAKDAIEQVIAGLDQRIAALESKRAGTPSD